MMNRRDDWQTRLAAYIEEVRFLPFAWGRHDCCLFAAGAVEAMTGFDPAAAWRGWYRSPKGAARTLRQLGGIEHLAAATLPPVAPLSADCGDVVVAPDPEGRPALGILTGAVIATPGPAGLAWAPRTAIQAAYHVPFRGEVI